MTGGREARARRVDALSERPKVAAGAGDIGALALANN